MLKALRSERDGRKQTILKKADDLENIRTTGNRVVSRGEWGLLSIWSTVNEGDHGYWSLSWRRRQGKWQWVEDESAEQSRSRRTARVRTGRRPGQGPIRRQGRVWTANAEEVRRRPEQETGRQPGQRLEDGQGRDRTVARAEAGWRSGPGSSDGQERNRTTATAGAGCSAQSTTEPSPSFPITGCGGPARFLLRKRFPPSQGPQKMTP